jgi:hypothetical protein
MIRLKDAPYDEARASGAGAAGLRAKIKVIMNGRTDLSMVLFSGKTGGCPAG